MNLQLESLQYSEKTETWSYTNLGLCNMFMNKSFYLVVNIYKSKFMQYVKKVFI